MIVANLFVCGFTLSVSDTEVIPDLLESSLYVSEELEAAVEGTLVGFF